MDAPTPWTFLTKQAAVLLCIHRHHRRDRMVRVRDIAAVVGVTERTVQHLLNDLETAGYLVRRRVGTRTHYDIDATAPLRDPAVGALGVGRLLALLAGEDRGRTAT